MLVQLMRGQRSMLHMKQKRRKHMIITKPKRTKQGRNIKNILRN